jgi:hypothetical protein
MDGRQPAKGPATLDGVRALTHKRVGGAEALRSRATAAVQPLLARARRWAAHLGTPVGLWRSDTQPACVRGSAAACPGVPPRDWAHPCWRATVKPVREADRRAKGQRRRQVRGGRALEREG